jgi:hypothetical protein
LIPLSLKKLQNKIIELNHDPIMYAHLDAKRTSDKICKNYYWPGISHQCRLYTRNCFTCQVHKTPAPNRYNRPLKPSLPNSPNNLINCDLIGPLPLTELKFCYALVMVDNFTKWAIVVPLKSKEAGEVSDAIYTNWYCKMGIPFQLQTDQGLEFCNDILKRLNERMAIGHKVTSPYYPQANGQVERFNRTLKTCLSIYSEEHPNNWDKYLNGITWAYNSSLNSQTGFSPYYLIYGREPRIPTDIFNGPINDIVYDLEQYNISLTSNLRNAYDIVKKNLTRAANAAKIAWDKKLVKSYTTFKVGDKILMYYKQNNVLEGELEHSHIWKRNWLGPFSIIAQNYKDNSDVYTIKDSKTLREWTVNVNKLRPYHGSGYLQNSLPGTDLLDSNVSSRQSVIPATSPPVESADHTPPDESISKTSALETESKMVKAPPIKIRKHKSSHRHKTGITVAEKKKYDYRLKNKDDKELTSESLKEYIIEQIVSHRRGKGGRMEYEIKWENYDETTWEPSHVFTSGTTLKEYWDQHPGDDCPKKFKNKKVKTSKK